jgi:LCP family protein required for cell wall assembly
MTKYTKDKIVSLADSPKKSRKKIFILATVAFTLLLVVSGVVFSQNARALFNPISIVSNIPRASLKETDGRTNVLILGRDTRPSGSLFDLKLTDVIIVASIGASKGDVVLISVPRDLWVESSDGYQEKINAMYKLGGVEETKGILENVLGMPIHYYAVVDFKIFKETVDILGGVDVNVARAFTDYTYPVEGKETAAENERYETVHFDAGLQTMNGATALKYVRSRHATDLEEGTDFARSKRQQNVIVAIKNKVLSTETLLNPGKISSLYDSYNSNVETNVDLVTAQSFAILAQKNNFETVKSIVLDNRDTPETGGLLFAPEDRSLYRNAYVLIPKAGDYSQIHAFVQKYLFGDK